jgi:uncharacterized membrane protein (UPF0136 family)
MLSQVRPTDRTRTLSTATLLAAGAVAQLLFISPLWLHSSMGGSILGRYSRRYALTLALSAAIMLGWGAAYIGRRWVLRWLDRLPHALRWTGVGLAAALAMGVLLALSRGVVKSFLMFNSLLVALILIRSLPDRVLSFRHWERLLLAVAVMMLFPALIAVLSNRRFSPDEAVYAIMSTGPFVSGGLYDRNWLEVPVKIAPGRGWSLAVYGWFLHNVSYNLMVGRVFNFAGYLLAFAGIWAVTARLFGSKPAAVSTVAAMFAPGIVTVLDLRPDHQLSAGAMLITFAAFQARYSRKAFPRAVWHVLCGLFATLSLEIHGAGIVYAAGFSLFYLAEFGIESYRQRRWASPEPLIWFGLGAAVGMATYYVFNIAPVGGLRAYLDHLVTRRGTRVDDPWTVLRTPRHVIVRAVAWGALIYLLWRRTWADVRFVGLFTCVALAGTILDTRGYPSLYNPFYLVPVGVLIVDGLGSASVPRGQNLHTALASGLVALAFGGMLWAQLRPSTFTDWLRTRQFPPYLYEKLGPVLRPYVSDTDVIVGTPSLEWSLPEHPHLVSVEAEAVAMKLWHVSGPEVWERAQPTVVVDVQQETTLPPGLEAYMKAHEFRVCQTFEVMGRHVLLYRATCRASSAGPG